MTVDQFWKEFARGNRLTVVEQAQIGRQTRYREVLVWFVNFVRVSCEVSATHEGKEDASDHVFQLFRESDCKTTFSRDDETS